MIKKSTEFTGSEYEKNVIALWGNPWRRLKKYNKKIYCTHTLLPNGMWRFCDGNYCRLYSLESETQKRGFAF